MDGKLKYNLLVRLSIAFAPTQCVRTIVQTLGHMATGAHIVGIARARAVHAHAVAGAVARRIRGRAAVDAVRDVEAGHIVGVVAEKVQQHRARVGHHFGHASDGKVFAVHEAA